jgi:hypothetical protein
LSSPVRSKKRTVEEVPESAEEWDLESINSNEWEEDEVLIVEERTVGREGPPEAKKQRTLISDEGSVESQEVLVGL